MVEVIAHLGAVATRSSVKNCIAGLVTKVNPTSTNVKLFENKQTTQLNYLIVDVVVL